MRQLLLVLVVIAACVGECRASDEKVVREIAGRYVRNAGMFSEILELRPGGVYVLTTHFDIGSEEQSGEWKVADAILQLVPKASGERKAKLRRFMISVVDGRVAFRVLDEASSHDENDPLLLFRPEPKKTANHFPLPPLRAAD